MFICEVALERKPKRAGLKDQRYISELRELEQIACAEEFVGVGWGYASVGG